MDFEEFGSLGKNGINIVGLAFMQKLRELTGIVPILYTDAYNASETWDWNLRSFRSGLPIMTRKNRMLQVIFGRAMRDFSTATAAKFRGLRQC